MSSQHGLSTLDRAYAACRSATTRPADDASFELHPRTHEPLRQGSSAKSDGVYALLKDYVRRGIPIDGVGMQLHVTHFFDNFEGVAQNMRRLAALGLEIHITELDVKCHDKICDLQQQARVYLGLLRVCLAQPACRNFETWGFTDKYTWISSNNRPLPFDEMFHPKPAFNAMVAELLRPA